jgi:hypothetical protein
MKSEDPNFIVKLEKAIEKRWGKEAIENPKSYWTPDKNYLVKKMNEIVQFVVLIPFPLKTTCICQSLNVVLNVT